MWFVWSVITSLKGLLIFMIEVMSIRKFRFSKAVYLSLFELFYNFAVAKLCSFLPQFVDKVMVLNPQLFSGVRLRTYDQESFKTVRQS